MITFPNAKINLGLHIVERRADGYHNLETIFYPIPVEDALELHPLQPRREPDVADQTDTSPAEVKSLEAETAMNDCRLSLSGIAVEGEPNSNLVVKAYRLLASHHPLPPVTIHLLKHIPTGAGLGGGSADAAFMLKMLNEQFSLHLSNDTLEEYAARLGADCAFFIRNQPVFAHGIGNLFRPIPLSLKGYVLWLVKPDIFVSTREAFAHITPHKPAISLEELIREPVERWRDRMVNDFEASVFPQHPRLAQLKENFYRQGALYAAMSGSGSSLFGLFAPGTTLPDVPMEEGAFEWKGVLQ